MLIIRNDKFVMGYCVKVGVMCRGDKCLILSC